MNDQLDFGKTYRAILKAARAKRFISYGALARANDARWQKVRYNMNRHLGDLVELAVKRGWPMLSVIVVDEKNVSSGELEGKALDGFIGAAKWLGFDVNDPSEFVKEQQRNVFDWASGAPDELEFSNSRSDEQPALPSDRKTENFLDGRKRKYWFVGAHWGEQGDQTERFKAERIWQYNGEKTRDIERIRRISPGDRIAIKASYVRKNRLPFDNQGQSVSCMSIKAIGTVTETARDEMKIKVDWRQFGEPKEWYFYTYRFTVNEADTTQEYARRLIRFAFGNRKQDYEFWLRQPYWAKRYRLGVAPVPDEEEEETAEEDAETDEAAPYGIDNILEDGCFLSEDQIADAFSALQYKKNLILQGPPGTGKTWLAKRLGYALVGTRDKAVTKNVCAQYNFTRLCLTRIS